MHDVSPREKGDTGLTKLLGGLIVTKKIQRYKMARWPLQQIPPFNFLDDFISRRTQLDNEENWLISRPT